MIGEVLCTLHLRQTDVNTGFPGFKRILVACEGMSVVIYDADDSPLTPPVPWQFPSLQSFHHYEADRGPLSLDVVSIFVSGKDGSAYKTLKVGKLCSYAIES